MGRGGTDTMYHLVPEPVLSSSGYHLHGPQSKVSGRSRLHIKASSRGKLPEIGHGKSMGSLDEDLI